MITPRRTRLVRVSDLQQFRHVIRAWCEIRLEPDPTNGPDLADTVRLKPDTTSDHCIVVVPTRAAAAELSRSLPKQERQPLLLTRDQLYESLDRRLGRGPRRLTAFDRESIAQAAAAAAARAVPDLPFQIRPGLVTEMLRFYDHLRRQAQEVARFETLITDALGGDEASLDRGAHRLLIQTRFLAEAFHEYERRVGASDACDEHELRRRLLAARSFRGPQHILVTVADWIADPAGLYPVDFDLLSRVPGVETLDLVSTDAVLASGFHERIHNWWPGLEETDAGAFGEPPPRVRPFIASPQPADPDRPWFTYRDREEELVAIADRLRDAEPAAWDSAAIVYKRPLPYLYLAPDTLGAARIKYQAVDALPLAAEPVVSTIDLILEAVETHFSRESLIALLMSPHLQFDDTTPGFRQSIAALNRVLSETRYLGGLDRLEALAGSLNSTKRNDAAEALHAALGMARELSVLEKERSASQQLATVLQILERRLRPLAPDDRLAERERLGRTALMEILRAIETARASHNDSPWTVDDLAAAIRRWIGDETFPIASEGQGVHLLDDQAARYGEFEDLTIVGLIENDWPDRPRRNIFYPPGLLKALGWPTEKDRRAAADARFLDLLTSASRETALSTFTLDDEALVRRSMQLDDVLRAKLSIRSRSAGLQACVEGGPKGPHYIRSADDSRWPELRDSRSPADADIFHGATGPRANQAWAVSALETYTACPFKFFAQHVLKLDEEPDDEEVMDPRRQGQFVHEVFESFFGEWQAAGHREITPANLDHARSLFADVVERSLARLPEGEAALERTRLLGSSAAAGLGEAVFRMEAERPIRVVERLLEHELNGRFTIETDSGPRQVALRGKADRVDLLVDGTFRLIDYKLGWPPDRNRALQLPIYGICAEQRLQGHRGQGWKLGEAVYLAFKGPKRVVPLFTATASRDEVLASAQQRLADTIDAIERGEFPPTPDDVFRCETCSFASVCRKDYVGDV